MGKDALDNIVKDGESLATTSLACTLSTLVAEADDEKLKAAAAALDKLGATASDLTSAMSSFLSNESQCTRKAAAKAMQSLGALGTFTEKVEEVLAEPEEEVCSEE